MPLGSNLVQVSWLAKQLSKVREALTWPEQSYGYYPVFVDYPGSMSLDSAPFSATAGCLLDSILFAAEEKNWHSKFKHLHHTTARI